MAPSTRRAAPAPPAPAPAPGAPGLQTESSAADRPVDGEGPAGGAPPSSPLGSALRAAQIPAPAPAPAPAAAPSLHPTSVTTATRVSPTPPQNGGGGAGELATPPPSPKTTGPRSARRAAAEAAKAANPANPAGTDNGPLSGNAKGPPGSPKSSAAAGPAARAAKGKRRSGPRSKSSTYIGVSQYRRTGRWEAHIWDSSGKTHVKGRQLHLGSFDSADDAARAYDRAALHFRGPGADTNFAPEQYAHDPVLAAMRDLSKEDFVLRLRSVAQSHRARKAPKSPRKPDPPSPRKKPASAAAKTSKLKPTDPAATLAAALPAGPALLQVPNGYAAGADALGAAAKYEPAPASPDRAPLPPYGPGPGELRTGSTVSTFTQSYGYPQAAPTSVSPPGPAALAATTPPNLLHHPPPPAGYAAAAAAAAGPEPLPQGLFLAPDALLHDLLVPEALAGFPAHSAPQPWPIDGPMDNLAGAEHALDAYGDFLHSTTAAMSNTPVPHGPLMTVLETVGEVCTDG